MKYFLIIILFILTLPAFTQTSTELHQHRQQYKADLFNNIQADTSKVDFYHFNQQMILTATVEMLKDEPAFEMITSSGTKKEAQKYVKVHFSYKGVNYTLFGYQLTQLKSNAGYADHFFIPFKDATTGNTTYSAGRYLDFKAGDIKDGKLVIDFNKAYNPYCAFTQGFNCPIPPRENTLKLAIAAGEKKYKGVRREN